KQFAIRIVRLYRALPNSRDAQVIGMHCCGAERLSAQITGPLAEAVRVPSLVAKLGIVLEEADETIFWLELLRDSSVVPADRLGPLLKEADELTAIFAAARKSSRSH